VSKCGEMTIGTSQARKKAASTFLVSMDQVNPAKNSWSSWRSFRLGVAPEELILSFGSH
jgi:hypothetical protein